jgi:Na+/H+-dicarboxylate symporter
MRLLRNKLFITLFFALVAGIFLGLAFGGLRNRIFFESAQMNDAEEFTTKRR